jgi:hypothetical protein
VPLVYDARSPLGSFRIRSKGTRHKSNLQTPGILNDDLAVLAKIATVRKRSSQPFVSQNWALCSTELCTPQGPWYVAWNMYDCSQDVRLSLPSIKTCLGDSSKSKTASDDGSAQSGSSGICALLVLALQRFFYNILTRKASFGLTRELSIFTHCIWSGDQTKNKAIYGKPAKQTSWYTSINMLKIASRKFADLDRMGFNPNDSNSQDQLTIFTSGTLVYENKQKSPTIASWQTLHTVGEAGTNRLQCSIHKGACPNESQRTEVFLFSEKIRRWSIGYQGNSILLEPLTMRSPLCSDSDLIHVASINLAKLCWEFWMEARILSVKPCQQTSIVINNRPTVPMRSVWA